jgi:hypothetical protein
MALAVAGTIAGAGVYGVIKGNTVIGCLLPFGILLFVALFIWGLRDNEPRVILDSEGISARDWGWVKIRWADIHDVKVVGVVRTGTTVVLDVSQPEQYTAALSESQRSARRINGVFAGFPFGFNTTMLNVPNEQIVAEIRRHIDG